MSKQQPGPTLSSFLLMLAVVAATCTMMAIAAVATNPTNANEVGRSIPPCPPPLAAEQPQPSSLEITVVTDFDKPLDGVEVRVELSGIAIFTKTDREGHAKTRYEPGEVSVTGTKSGYITTQETIKLTPPATKATIKLHKSTPPPEQDKSA